MVKLIGEAKKVGVKIQDFDPEKLAKGYGE